MLRVLVGYTQCGERWLLIRLPELPIPSADHDSYRALLSSPVSCPFQARGNQFAAQEGHVGVHHSSDLASKLGDRFSRLLETYFMMLTIFKVKLSLEKSLEYALRVRFVVTMSQICLCLNLLSRSDLVFACYTKSMPDSELEACPNTRRVCVMGSLT